MKRTLISLFILLSFIIHDFIISLQVSSEIPLMCDSKSTPLMTNNDPSVIQVQAILNNPRGITF